MSKVTKYRHIFKHFEQKDPKIWAVMQTIDYDEWLEETDKKDYFKSLCRAIIGQQLAGKAANAIFARFSKLFDIKVLLPSTLSKMDDTTLREVGISWAKVRSLKDLAKKINDNQLDLSVLDKLEDKEVVQELIQVKGIGPWTAEMFLMFTLQRENVFSYGDLGLKKGIIKIYKLRKPSEKNIKKIITKWNPYKTYGSIALWHTLDNT